MELLCLWVRYLAYLVNGITLLAWLHCLAWSMVFGMILCSFMPVVLNLFLTLYHLEVLR